MKQKKVSIQWRILGITVGCWLIPFAFILVMMVHYLVTNQTQQKVDRYSEQISFTVKSSTERLNRAVEASREASLDGTLRDVVLKKETYSDYQEIHRVKSYLVRKYKKMSELENVIFWDYKEPRTLNGAVYNTSAGGSFNQIKTYWKKDHEQVAAYAEKLDTKIGFLNLENRLYMIRNVVNRNYEPLGTLVMRLNESECFEGLIRFSDDYPTLIWLNDMPLEVTADGLVNAGEQTDIDTYKKGAQWKNNYLYMKCLEDEDAYEMTTLTKIPKGIVLESVYGYLGVMLGMVILLIPLLYIIIHMVRSHILEPMDILMEGAQQVEEGKFGYRIDKETKNREFQYLTDSFNSMSEKLKYQFDHIYQEELALRDARIMALQAHINPHFMNNTLEIINWEARLAGNMKISQMIESLSVLMNAAMDRKKCPEVTLKEEMVYVEAYLHIMRERLGNRLVVKKELAEDTMEEKIPRLILQPLIENAIEHGVIPNRSGTILIRSRKEGSYLYLEIVNNGRMTKEEKAKVQRLLEPDYDTSKETSGNLGIANVNQRLSILYGENSHLEMVEEQDDYICARLTIFVGAIEQN